MVGPLRIHFGHIYTEAESVALNNMLAMLFKLHLYPTLCDIARFNKKNILAGRCLAPSR